MISFNKIKSYILRLVGCIAVVVIICGICYTLRSAIVDYTPIEISMKAQFPQEQNVKIYYTSSIYDEFSKNNMQECHVNRMEEESLIKCQLVKVGNISKIKFEFSPNTETIQISNITVSSDNQSTVLDDMSKFKIENTYQESVAGNVIKFKSNKMNPSLVYTDDLKIYSSGSVWFFPVNVYTCSVLIILIFAGFWWLLSVISVINRDIETSLIKKETV